MNRLVLIIVLWVSFSLQALAAETISSGVLAKGTQWETTFYRRDSGVDGPVVLVTGGIHGNESAGATGCRTRFGIGRSKKGRLIVVPRAKHPRVEGGDETSAG